VVDIKGVMVCLPVRPVSPGMMSGGNERAERRFARAAPAGETDDAHAPYSGASPPLKGEGRAIATPWMGQRPARGARAVGFGELLLDHRLCAASPSEIDLARFNGLEGTSMKMVAD